MLWKGSTCLAVRVINKLIVVRLHPTLPQLCWFTLLYRKLGAAELKTLALREPDAASIAWKLHRCVDI